MFNTRAVGKMDTQKKTVKNDRVVNYTMHFYTTTEQVVAPAERRQN